jgi:uroporphyrinogen III methyltransferase / synthase
MNDTPSIGKIYLVGAGPGDPRLITLRGVECLRQADVVLFDYLVNPELVEHAPCAAERICLEHHGGGKAMSQDAINEKMIAEARQGKTVVRLKNGDPAVFGRLAEEVAALRAAAIPLEVIPGVTAGLAAAACAAIPITNGSQSSAVALVTGHERDDKAAPRLDYAALAAFPGTLIIYMGVNTAAQWSAALIGAGKSPGTPVAIVRRCSWPDQEVIACTLESVVEVARARGVHPPAVFLVGEVVGYALDGLLQKVELGLYQSEKTRSGFSL